MKVHKIDHVGIVVHDLPAAKAFFLDLGFEDRGEGHLQEEAVGRIIGLDNAKVTFNYLSLPGDQGSIELIKFHAPPDKRNAQKPFSNTPGIRHIALEVDSIENIIAKLEKTNMEPLGSVQTLGGYKLCYVRGPEDIILELAEKVH